MKKAEYIRPEIMTVDVLTESSYALTVTGIGGDGGEGGPGTIGDGAHRQRASAFGMKNNVNLNLN